MNHIITPTTLRIPLLTPEVMRSMTDEQISDYLIDNLPWGADFVNHNQQRLEELEYIHTQTGVDSKHSLKR